MLKYRRSEIANSDVAISSTKDPVLAMNRRNGPADPLTASGRKPVVRLAMSDFQVGNDRCWEERTWWQGSGPAIHDPLRTWTQSDWSAFFDIIDSG
jgi:hypothetical protein